MAPGFRARPGSPLCYVAPSVKNSNTHVIAPQPQSCSGCIQGQATRLESDQQVPPARRRAALSLWSKFKAFWGRILGILRRFRACGYNLAQSKLSGLMLMTPQRSLLSQDSFTKVQALVENSDGTMVESSIAGTLGR